MLLFQDLAVVPLLVLLPALDQAADALGAALAIALGKAVLALAVVITLGPKLMRAWLGIVARRRSNELFVLNGLLVTLLLAFVTGLAGLSLVLGAFLAGMLISETEFRFQVEEDIKPFRDVLLGLFFVTVGMMLDLRLVLGEFPLVMLLFVLLVGAKFALIALLASAFGSAPGTALRVGIALAQAGEFGFVLLSLTASTRVVPEPVLQALLAAMILSMLATPFLIAASDRIVMRLSGAEWMLRSLELHRIAAQSIEVERHVIVLGYGRNGQRLARLLDAEGVRYVALDLDPERVREAALAGDAVVFADSSRREALVAAGIARAAGVVVTFADVDAAVRVLAHIHALNPAVPVIVRARDEDDIPRLTAAGASEVVPEAFESGVMLASHTLVLVGVPLSRVMRRMSQVRGEQYQLRRGLQLAAHGAGQALAVVHLRVDGNRDLVGQVGRADDEPGESARAGGSPQHRSARAVAGLHADQAGDRVERLLRAVAGNEPCAPQIVPPLARFRSASSDDRGARSVISSVDHAIPAARERRWRCRPARPSVGVVARDGAVAVLVAVVGRRDAGEIRDHVLDLRLGDHFLPLQDAAQQQPDDHQHDRDLHQREALLPVFHSQSPLDPSRQERTRNIRATQKWVKKAARTSIYEATASSSRQQRRSFDTFYLFVPRAIRASSSSSRCLRNRASAGSRMAPFASSPPIMIFAASSSLMSSRMKISICLAHRGTSSEVV